MAEVGQLWVKLGLDKTNFESGMNESKNQSSGLAGFIKNAFEFTVGAGMFDIIKNGIKAAWDTSIGYNSQIQQSQAAFTTLLGNGSKAAQMLGSLSKMAADTPFELTDLNKASQTLLGFGIDANKILPDLKMLGDVSMGNKDKLQGLALVFAQVQSQGKLMGQDLLQMINNGFNPLQVISKQTGKSMAELKDEMSKGGISADMVANAFKGATEKGGLFYGSMDKQSKTFEGQMSTLSDNVKSTLGGVLKTQFEYLSNTILPAAIDKVNKFGDAFKSGGLNAAMKTIIPAGLVDGLTSVGNAIQGVFGWIEQHGPLVKTVLAGITAGFAAYKVAVMASIVQQQISNALEAIHAIRLGQNAVALLLEKGATENATIAQKLLNAAMDANGLGIIIALVTALVGVLIYLWNTNEGFRTAVIGVWNSIKSAFFTAIEGIKGFFVGLIEGVKKIPAAFAQLKAQLAGIFMAIGTYFITAWNNIRTSVMNLVGALINGIQSKFSMQLEYIEAAALSIKYALVNAWTLIKNIVLGIVLLFCDLITGNFTQLKSDFNNIMLNIKMSAIAIWDGIRTAIVNIIRMIRDTAIEIFNALAAFFVTLWLNIKNTAITAWNTFKTAVIEIIKAVVKGATDIWNGLLNWFSKLPDTLYNYGSNMFTSMKNGVTSTIGNVKTAVTDGVQSAIDFLKALPGEAYTWGSDMIQGFINGIKSMVGSIGSAVSGVADKIRSMLHFSVPDEGPLRDYESWMPDFILGMTKGIEDNKYKLINSVKALASGMTLNVKGSMPDGINKIFSSENNNQDAGQNIFYVTIDAKNVKDFTDVVNLFLGLVQAKRAFG